VVNLGRMNRVRVIDAADFTMTVDAGLILAEAQEAAAEVKRFFPLSLAAEGSCQIGGNISTNAGGTGVLRYGNMRDLVLGLEVVLPDGRIWNGLRSLRKDNTGYDLKHLFIGAEGTLGIITGAALKLFPDPAARETAMVGVRDLAAGVDLLALLRRRSGDGLLAFEFLSRAGLEMTLAHISGIKDPLADIHPYYILIETSALQLAAETTEPDGRALATMLEPALASDLIQDAVVAQNGTQRDDLWRIRETLPEAQTADGASVKNDVAVPVARLPEMITRATAAVERACPGIRVIAFGHLGDGNVHFNLSQPLAADGAGFLARWDELTGMVSDVAEDLGGTFSAEHGIGLVKRSDLAARRSAIELDLMRRLKSAFDPKGLMNPGKMLP
jgi:D-lactate dehydrogenase (cytochrome)